MPKTLCDVLASRAAGSPDALAFADDRRRVTFGELAATADELADGLARRGVGPGDRVALVAAAGVRFAELFWALQVLGATPCAFNPTTPSQTLARRVEAIRPRLVLTEDLVTTGSGAAAPEPVGADADALAFLQPTSGTSGEPRAAMLTHRNVLQQLRATRDAGHIVEDDVFVSWVPPWHDLGLVRFMIGPVYFGTPCHIVEPAIRTIPDWLSTVSRVRATHTGAPDFAYRLACRLVDPRSVDLSSLRYSVNGGEPVRRATIEQFEARFNAPRALTPGYGLAEATLGVATHPPGAEIVVDGQGAVSCGFAFPGLDLSVPGPPRTHGEILVRGHSVFAGYLDAPEASAAVLRDGWMHTGDIGYLDDDGRLFVLGRQRAMIKRGGAVIAPRELEEAAHRVSGVRLAAAVGMTSSSEAVSERVIVVVEADAAEGAPAAAMTAGVTTAIRDRLGFAPHRVLVVPPRTIPLTANGKVRHSMLTTLLAAQSPDCDCG
jgi:fatty-acyl-CoA synthase